MTNERILKITGSACLEKGLEFGKEYRLALIAETNKISTVNREDGTHDIIYSAKLINAAILGEKETIKTKDKKRRSQKMRSALYLVWQEEGAQGEFDDFYDKTMAVLNYNIADIYNQFVKRG